MPVDSIPVVRVIKVEKVQNKKNFMALAWCGVALNHEPSKLKEPTRRVKRRFHRPRKFSRSHFIVYSVATNMLKRSVQGLRSVILLPSVSW